MWCGQASRECYGGFQRGELNAGREEVEKSQYRRQTALTHHSARLLASQNAKGLSENIKKNEWIISRNEIEAMNEIVLRK